MSIFSIEIYTRKSCIFCVNLKRVILDLLHDNLIPYPVIWKEAPAEEVAPYIIKYTKLGNNQTLYGFPEKRKLYHFLELENNEIKSITKTESRKFFSLPK